MKNGEPNYLYHNPDDDEKLNAYTTTSSVNIEYIYGADGLMGFITHKAGELAKTYYYRKNLQGDITHIFEEVGGKKLLKAKYVYDAWGNHTIVRDDAGIGTLNSFRYRGYYYDSETGLYWLHSRYYDPETGRFINADDISILNESKSMINGLNLYAYCGNNPVMRTDPTGRAWWHWVVGAVVIVGLAIAVVATGGAAGGVAGFILAGALKGAVIGAVSGALIGGTIGGITSAISGGSFWGGFLDGAADGFMSGAIIGGATGALSNGIKVMQAAKSWVSTGGKSGFQQMTQHYTKHVINEGQKAIAKNIVNYTKQATQFFANNNAMGQVLREGVIKIAGAPGGIFNVNGLIRSFWYILK